MDLFFTPPQGHFKLDRLPYRKHELLRAWDAADEYLLSHFANLTVNSQANITLLNDSFGALALALSNYQPIAISDSYLSQLATRHNLQANGLETDSVTLLDSLTIPDLNIDYLLIKTPKTLALLEDQLYRLRPCLTDNSTIIAAGMVKNLPPTLWKLLEKNIGPTTSSLAVKKARLLFATFDPNLKSTTSGYPSSYYLENSRFQIWNHANVFSRTSLDIGSRFLLQHLPDNPNYREIIDLGCGNGVIGLCLADKLPAAKIYFVDESYMALASAKLNFQTAWGDQRAVEFRTDDCLSSFTPASADCIVCNPPFHQQHTIGDHIAWKMFQQSYQVLRKGGELRVIGNRHLQYQINLRKLFGRCEIIASNNKFVIMNCFKR